jgi:hypothetical protein
MTPINQHAAGWAGARSPGMSGQETYEQLLALADQVGAAYSEAWQRLSSAYTGACQKLVADAGGLPGKLSGSHTEALNALMDPAGLSERLENVQENAVAVGEEAAAMGIEVGLACLNAFEQAALAVAKFQEQVGAASQLDLVKSTTAAGAELIRKVTRASAGTLRDMSG